MMTLLIMTLGLHFLCDIGRMERQRREDELKNRSSKKTQEAEQSTSKRVRFCVYLCYGHLFYCNAIFGNLRSLYCYRCIVHIDFVDLKYVLALVVDANCLL